MQPARLVLALPYSACMSTDERQQILLESYQRAAQDLADELEVQLAKLRALLPETRDALASLHRNTAELNRLTAGRSPGSF